MAAKSRLRGPTTKPEIVKEILMMSAEIKPIEIRENLKTLFPNAHIPQIRAIQKIIKRNPIFSPSWEDKPWCLGASKKYNIPTKILISMQRMLLAHGRYLTIRRAKWLTILSSFFCDNISDKELIKLFIISATYSRREQISELNQEEYADTTDLDRIFIIEKDLTLETILSVWTDEYSLANKSETAKAEDDTIQDLELTLFKHIPITQKIQCTKWIKLFVELGNERKSIKPAVTFIKEHPEIEELALKLLAFSLRTDLIKMYLDYKKDNKEGAI